MLKEISKSTKIIKAVMKANKDTLTQVDGCTKDMEVVMGHIGIALIPIINLLVTFPPSLPATQVDTHVIGEQENETSTP